VAHEAELAVPGDVRCLEVGGRQIMMVRTADGAVTVLGNRCPHSPHELLGAGFHRGQRELVCPLHGLRWTLEGVPVGRPAQASLDVLASRCVNGIVLLLPATPPPVTGHALIDLLAAQPRLEPVVEPRVWQVAADWKFVVEHWLDVWLSSQPDARLGRLSEPVRIDLDAAGRVDWAASVARVNDPWTLARFSNLAADVGETLWSRHFVAPNTLVERHAGGMTLMVVAPVAAGESRIEVRCCAVRTPDARRRALAYLALRLARPWMAQDCDVVASLQRAALAPRPVVMEAPAGSAVAAFRRQIYGAV